MTPTPHPTPAPAPAPVSSASPGTAGGSGPAPGGALRAWSELLRVSALFSVPGDALAGAAATGAAPNRRTGYAMGASLCLYEAGMALNDWSDRAEDAAERPHRPLPSGRIAPAAALAAAAGLTAAGLASAARAGRPAAALAAALATTVWAYDLGLKHTRAAPATMAAARSLDLLLGAAATHTPGLRGALLPAAALGGHTWAVTCVSRRETQGGAPGTALAALGTTVALGALAARPTARPPGVRRPARPATPGDWARTALAAAYVATAAKPFLHAALNPSPPLTQRAVGGGIRAMIPLQAALAARAGAAGTAAAVTALIPAARLLARKVSPT